MPLAWSPISRDALGRVTHVEYELNGSVKEVVTNFVDPPPSSDEEHQYNLSEEYVYDQQGRLWITKNTNGVPISTLIYNDSGQVEQVLDALNNPTNYPTRRKDCWTG